MKTKNNPAGFTLIELIITLVIAAIAGTMLYTYMGSMLARSSNLVLSLQNTSQLNQVMENIIADYNRLNALNLRYKWQASTPYRVGAVVFPSVSNGYYYTCSTAGTSGASEPAWPTTTGATVSNGTVIWKVGGVIWKSSGTPSENIIWKSSQSYSVNNIMIPIINDGHYYRCTTAHTTTGSEPSKWIGSISYSVGIIVMPSSYNGHYYRCTTAGTSGATEPAWSATAGSVTIDGPVRWTEIWTEAGTILAKSTTTASSNDDVLNDNIWNYLMNTPARYGAGYTVVTAETKFVKFSSAGVEQNATGSDEKNILKVTIQDSSSGERLTQLLTIR